MQGAWCFTDSSLGLSSFLQHHWLFPARSPGHSNDNFSFIQKKYSYCLLQPNFTIQVHLHKQTNKTNFFFLTMITNSESLSGLRILHSILAINSQLTFVDSLTVVRIYKANSWHIHFYFKLYAPDSIKYGVHWNLSAYSEVRYNFPRLHSHQKKLTMKKIQGFFQCRKQTVISGVY